MQKRKELKDNSFYRHIFKLVLPIIIQNLLNAAVSSADVLMLNYVGQSSISAVSLASQYASIALIFPLFFFVKNFEDGKWAVPDLMVPLTGHAWIPLIFLSVAALFTISLAVSTVGYCRRK